MARKRKRQNGRDRGRKYSAAGVKEHVLDQLYGVIDGHKGADPDASNAARLFVRGRQQIAKKLGEEAVETLIEGIRGDRQKLVSESADMLYHLLILWASVDVEPKAVWAEIARREKLSAVTVEVPRKPQ